MKSVRTKLTLLVSGAIIGVFLILSAVGIYTIQELIDEDANTVISMLSEEKCSELNVHFQRTEQAVETLEKYVVENVDTERLKKDDEYEKQFMDEMAVRCIDAAKVAGNVEAVYFRPDPVLYKRFMGFFLTDNRYGDYISTELTDILSYKRDDREHVSWYYEPIDSGKAIWLEPYYNKNINVYMISYVAPITVNGNLLGVIGMDINMADIHAVVDSVDYANGFGFLVGEEGNIVYHRDYPEGLSSLNEDSELKAAAQYLTRDAGASSAVNRYQWHGQKHRLVTGNLDNGMIFAISVPEKEIMSRRSELQTKMSFVVLVVLLLVLLVSRRVMGRIVRPIRELTDAASHIAKGELNVSIDHKSADEIGNLADSIRSMQKELKEYITYVHDQAYTDAMTGVGNKTAYLDLTRLLEKKIEENMADFSVAVFDINGLKLVNDNYGHEVGDVLITNTASLIKQVFGAEHVYRIGGDEFIVVMEKTGIEPVKQDFEKLDKSIAEFNRNISEGSVPVAVSKGVSVYKAGKDVSYKDVFRRADEEMYRDKKRYYQQKGADRRKR